MNGFASAGLMHLGALSIRTGELAEVRNVDVTGKVVMFPDVEGVSRRSPMVELASTLEEIAIYLSEQRLNFHPTRFKPTWYFARSLLKPVGVQYVSAYMKVLWLGDLHPRIVVPVEERRWRVH